MASIGVPARVLWNILPITIFDLATGARSAASLTVRMTLKIQRPGSNYSGDENRFSAMVPLPFEIYDMQVIGSDLRIFLSSGSYNGPKAYLDFPLPKNLL